MPIPDSIIDAVAATNLKNVGEAPAFYSGLAMGNAVSNQQSMNALQQAAVGSIIKGLTEVDPSEAVAALKMTSGNEVATTLGQLLAALQSGQVGTKVAQTTPPVTP